MNKTIKWLFTIILLLTPLVLLKAQGYHTFFDLSTPQTVTSAKTFTDVLHVQPGTGATGVKLDGASGSKCLHTAPVTLLVQETSADCGSAPANLLPPPFPVPAGQGIAWSFPSAVQYGDSGFGSASPNGSAYAGTSYAYLSMTQSCGLCNWSWAAQWSGFTVPTLPNDAVIQGVYGVAIVQGSGTTGAAVSVVAGPTVSINSVSPGGIPLNTPGGGGLWGPAEYYSGNIGTTALTVTTSKIGARMFATLAQSFNQNLTVNAPALAIYYTTATPAPQAGNQFIVPTVTPSSVSPPYTVISDSGGVAWNFNYNYRNNTAVTLNANRTLTISNAPDGAHGYLIVTQDATGGRTLTAGGCKVVNGGAGALSLSAAAGAVDIIHMQMVGSTCYIDYLKNYT